MLYPYTINTDARKKVVIGIFILSILLSSVLTYWLEAPISNVKVLIQKYEWIEQLFKICDAVGVTTNFIGIPSLFLVLYQLFDRVIWHWKWVRKIHGVPDLRGHWEGTLKSITAQKTLDMKLDVKQTWTKINFFCTFPKSTSSSNVASIFTDRDGVVKIGFGFFNQSRELPQQYDGYNILNMDDETHLFGRYFNNRDNSNIGGKEGNIGTFELSKSD